MATIEPTDTERTVLPGRPPFTVDDLLNFPDDGNRYELFNGSLLVSPSPTPLHQLMITNLLIILQSAAPPHLVTLTTVNLRATDKDYYIPDLVVVPREIGRSMNLMLAPQDILLTVEVGSPSTKMRDEQLKAEVYARAGIPVYLRIEPDEGPALYVYELGDEDADEYGPPTVYKAGTVANLTMPFPVSFDPGQLAE
ncbi:Uma2 family endonuclease [Nonomuraea antimicrobica]